MYNATLIYELDTNKRIPVKAGSLVSIDTETMNIEKPSLLMQKFKKPIMTLLNENKDYVQNNPDNKGRFLIEYVKDSDIKEELPVIYKRDKFRPILTRTIPLSIETLKKSNIRIEKSEIERARQLLLSSKYKRFLTAFLKSDIFHDTTAHKMKVSKDEYDKAREIGIEGFIKNNQYGLTIREAFIYLYKANRLGSMRVLVEDALELWKKNLENLEDDELYYYARNIRCLIDDYYANINYTNKTVTNLKVSDKMDDFSKAVIITDINYYRPLKSGQLIKRKLPKAG